MGMKVEKQFSADLAQLPEILNWIHAQIEKTELSDSDKMRVELAMEEAIVNVITHAALDHSLVCSLVCIQEPKSQIEFQLKDSGPPFNPLAHIGESQNELSLDERKPGGLGIAIMRKYMDVLLYRREENQNILTLIKIINSS